MCSPLGPGPSLKLVVFKDLVKNVSSIAIYNHYRVWLSYAHICIIHWIYIYKYIYIYTIRDNIYISRMGWNWNHQIDIDANAIVACGWTQYHHSSAGSNPCSPEQALHWACEVCKTICAIVLSSSIVIPKQPHFQRSKFKMEVDIDLLEYIWTYFGTRTVFFYPGTIKIPPALFRPFGSFNYDGPKWLSFCHRVLWRNTLERGKPQKYLLKFYIDYIRYLPLWYPLHVIPFYLDVPYHWPCHELRTFFLGWAACPTGRVVRWGEGQVALVDIKWY